MEPALSGALPRRESPPNRLRRLRRSETLRELLAERRFGVQRTVYPILLRPGVDARDRLAAMPGIFRYSVDEAVRHAGEASDAGVPAVMALGQSAHRDARGRESYNPEGPVPRFLREVKRLWPDLATVADVCLCAYTTHHHCGVWTNGRIDNDATLELLEKAAVTYARAGADFVAPSAMMDHQVGRIRAALDDAGCTETGIVAGSASFASPLYAPFRAATGTEAPDGGGHEHQLDPRNGREALREIELDLAEGADLVLLRPAITSLDVIARARDRFPAPIAAFQTGGEYAMIQAAADRGWIDGRAAAIDSLTAIHRAGADLVVTYFALQLQRWTRAPAE